MRSSDIYYRYGIRGEFWTASVSLIRTHATAPSSMPTASRAAPGAEGDTLNAVPAELTLCSTFAACPDIVFAVDGRALDLGQRVPLVRQTGELRSSSVSLTPNGVISIYQINRLTIAEQIFSVQPYLLTVLLSESQSPHEHFSSRDNVGLSAAHVAQLVRRHILEEARAVCTVGTHVIFRIHRKNSRRLIVAHEEQGLDTHTLS